MKMLVRNKILVPIRLTKLDAFCPLKSHNSVGLFK